MGRLRKLEIGKYEENRSPHRHRQLFKADRRGAEVSETCSNCKFMKFYNDGRLYPYKCTKENAKSYTEKAIENRNKAEYKCDKYEAGEE